MYIYNGCTKDPSTQIISCPSLHRSVGSPNTSSYCMKNVGGEKGKLICYLPRLATVSIDCGAMSDVFSVHAGTCAVNTKALYVLHDLYEDSNASSPFGNRARVFSLKITSAQT
jgi:hypothetical protein